MKPCNEILREMREDRDLKQSEIAAIIGTTQQQYSKYETGESELPLRALAVLADHYGVSADYLMGRIDGLSGVPGLSKKVVGGVTLKDVMVDVKVREPSQEFYRETERVLRETEFLNSSYFFGHGDYFRGKGPKSSMNLGEREEFFAKYGKRSKDYFFLFAAIDEINARTVEWAGQQGIMVMCCENLPFRGPVPEDNIPKAGRNFRWLQELGVVYYQIDSPYDVFFRTE